MGNPHRPNLSRFSRRWQRTRAALYDYAEKNGADMESWARRRAERELGLPLNRKGADEVPAQSGVHGAGQVASPP
jgi:hypothetical protein